MNYDVFNGDADGIIALLQIRLNCPQENELVTGVKRDIQLLDKIAPRKGDQVTVLDISMEKNSLALNAALNAGAKVAYFDHHRCGDIPEHSALEAHIDLDPNTCTSLLVDKKLSGKFHLWAITAAYGDNLIQRADELCRDAKVSKEQAEQLKEFGTLINYNGYGSDIGDLHYHPAELYTALLKYQSPLEAIADIYSPFYRLRDAYNQDMKMALSVNPYYESQNLKVYELPNELWSKRISGVYGNLLANEQPSLAHAVLTLNVNGTYMVSLRAPLHNKQGAGDICNKFKTGGGRAAAAGINALPSADLNAFIAAVESYY